MMLCITTAIRLTLIFGITTAQVSSQRVRRPSSSVPRTFAVNIGRLTTTASTPRTFAINSRRRITTTKPSGMTPTINSFVTTKHLYVNKGTAAKKGEFPYMVFIRLQGQDQCGGTLLSEEWVLTAAHCLHGKTATNILIGALTNDGKDTNGVNRGIQRKCCHKDFNLRTFAHDICLIKLSSPVVLGTKFIQKVRLPQPGSSTQDGDDVKVTGWGLTENLQLLPKLQKGVIRIVNKRLCKMLYGPDGITIPSNHFCAGKLEGGTDTCRGDSGGPLLVEENGVLVQHGITSFGPKECGIKHKPGVYVSVSAYVSWINKKMNNPCQDFRWSPWVTTCSVTCGLGTQTRRRRCLDDNSKQVPNDNCRPGRSQIIESCIRPTCPGSAGKNVVDSTTTIPRTLFLVNGSPASIGAYPFMVFIRLNPSQCGGTLLSESWVLTAAHCFDSYTPTEILIGAYRNDGTDPNAVKRTMASKCCHKDYNKVTLENDICLVKLSSPVTYGTYIKNGKLPAVNAALNNGQTCTIMGWGLNENNQLLPELLEADVNVIGKTQCKQWYSTSSVTIPDSHFCAGHTGSGADTCDGDSGGPLVVLEGGEFVIYGITSFGPSACGAPQKPGVYTQVSKYISWINEKTNEPCESFSWGPWQTTDCSVTCGSGSEVRIRICRNSNGAAVQNTLLCGQEQSTQVGDCTRPPCPEEFSWSSWQTTCSVTCGSGTETRTRECRDRDGVKATDTLCGQEPSSKNGFCNKPPCPMVFSWSSWRTTCSVTCGSGMETRVRDCINSNGVKVSDTLCGQEPSSQAGDCTRSPCPADDFSWSSWQTTCSVTCGSGTETRTRECRDRDGVKFTDTLCGQEPSSQVTVCMKSPCPVSPVDEDEFSWSSWQTTCSVTCGSGTESRTRDCRDRNGMKVADTLCGREPSSQESVCSRSPCSVSPLVQFSWTSWQTTCSVTCGSGTETRVRVCQSTNGVKVPDTLCGREPSSQVGVCTKPACPSIYQWGPWQSVCTVTCGSGTELRTRSCKNENMEDVDVSFCGGSSTEQRVCFRPNCPVYIWTPWSSSCDVTCGNGTENRERSCVNENGQKVLPSLCGDAASTEIRECSRPACLPQHQWGRWRSICSVSCGRGKETRIRGCLDRSGRPASTRFCLPGKSIERGDACLRPRCIVYFWSQWTSDCSVTCGVGVRTKTRKCKDNNGKTVRNTLCGPTKAVVRETCTRQPCQVYQWSSWTNRCLVTCGKGTEFRVRSCKDTAGRTVASTHCGTGSEFEVSECNLAPCTPVVSYRWGPWKATCSVTCGRGSEWSTRECFSSRNEKVSTNFCSGRPQKFGLCELQGCRGSSSLLWGEWGDWSACRTRTISTNRCDGFRSATRNCFSGGTDVNPWRCISSIGGDYYRESTCRPIGC